MESPPDLVLLQAGDEAEWSRVERMYAPRLAAYLARRVRDREAREDIVQECFLVAVRNIARVDPALGFEPYLFNILSTRTIDWMRRQRPVQLSGLGMEESAASFDFVAAPPETPSSIVRRDELEENARRLLGAAARAWCQESFTAQAFERVAVIEGLLVRGQRNKDVAARLGHRDDTVVAGIKFRALKRLAELVDELAQGGSVKAAVLAHLAHEERGPDVDFAAAWSAARAACPPRTWMLALLNQATTPEQVHVRLHVPDCAGCAVELDALRRDPASLDMQRVLPVIERTRRDSFNDT